MSKPILVIKDLKKYFPLKGGIFSKVRGYVRAVNGVSFHIQKGEVMGLVGESGCGKTTVGLTILRLVEPTEGEILFEGKNIVKLNYKEMNKIRREMQIVFQDPFSSLNPRMSVKGTIEEALATHSAIKGQKLREKMIDLLHKVGLEEELLYRFPHELSGGQRQRVSTARALATNPKFVVLDEPTSFLDVSVQAQTLNLFKKLQNDLGLSYLFISHDLAVVHYICDRIAVMYAGKIVETSDIEELIKKPLHPYTQALFSAIPMPSPKKEKKRIILKGEVPNPAKLPSGCIFHPRCPYVKSQCIKVAPNLTEIGKNHFVACHLIDG
jgi:oligopeptide/dipeptide ABC transporter ATP-binding protein